MNPRKLRQKAKKKEARRRELLTQWCNQFLWKEDERKQKKLDFKNEYGVPDPTPFEAAPFLNQWLMSKGVNGRPAEGRIV